VGPGEAQRRVLVDLAQKVHLTVHLSVLRNQQLVYVDKLEADTPFKMRSSAGRIQPVHSSAIGKSVLALLDEGQARTILRTAPLERFTSRTVTDVNAVLRQLPTIRSRGWATDDEEDEEGTRAIGAAFVDDDGRPMGGISIVAPTFAASMAELAQHAGALKDAVDAMGRIYDVQARSGTAPTS
jgi:IclR family transcriptional regulator, acetate operon repressor